MKKKSIFLSIFTIALCLTMLASIATPKKKPILANEMCKAEEVIEYSIEETNDNEEIIQEDQENEEQNDCCDDCETCIFVIGKAKLTLTPDMATITACIEKFNEDMNISKNENLETLNSVMSALKNQGVSEEKLTLDYFSAHPSYDYSTGYTPVGYYSKSCFSFQIDNLENIENYISVLTENGVTNICDIRYSLSNMEEEYNNALTQALENAKTKATALFDSEEIKICGVREESVYSASSLSRNFAENLSSSFIGQVEIEARVNVMFKKV